MDWVSIETRKPGHRVAIAVRRGSGEVLQNMESRFGVVYDPSSGGKALGVTEWMSQVDYEKEQKYGGRKTTKRGDSPAVEQ